MQMCYLDTPGAAFAAYLCRNAAEPSKVPPTAGVHTRGPGDGLVVEDGEGQLAIRDEDNLKSVYLQQRREESAEQAEEGQVSEPKTSQKTKRCIEKRGVSLRPSPPRIEKAVAFTYFKPKVS